MLHISNIADGEAVSTEIQNALRQHGTLVSFRYFEQVRARATPHALRPAAHHRPTGQDKRMALATFSSVGEAVAALVSCHNTRCGSSHFKLSFAKPRA